MYLKTLNPDAEITNYAVAGSSVLWSVYQLNWVKEHNPADFYIFQITRPERLSFWKDNVVWTNYLKNTNNILMYDSTVYNAGLQTLTVQNVEQQPSLNAQGPATKLAKNYYKLINDEFFKIEYDLAVRYIKDNVDFYYMQTEGPERGYNDILCLEYEFGYDYCDKHWESGTHFGHAGLKRTAEWVKENAGL
jgi:hypothetical protein